MSAQCLTLANSPEERWRARILSAEVAVALRNYDRALSLLESEPGDVKNPALSVSHSLAVGLAKLRMGRVEQARPLLTQALSTARRFQWPELQAKALVRHDFPDLKPQERRAMLEEAIAQARLARDPVSEAEAAGALGYMELFRLGHPLVAIRWFEESSRLAERAGALGLLQKNIGNTGEAHVSLGNYELATELHFRAAELAGRIGNHTEQIVWLNNLGNTENLQHRPDRARPYYATALVLARQHGIGLARPLNNLANVAIQSQDSPAAWRYYKEATEARRAPDASPAPDFTLGYLYTMDKRYDDAIGVFRQIIADPRPDIKRQARISLAGTYFEAGRKKEAFAEADAVLDDIRQQRAASKQLTSTLSMQSHVARFYRAYVRMLLEENRDTDALLIAEEARSGTRQTAEALMQIAGRRNAVILNYWPGERSSALWIITPAGIVRRPLPKESELRELLAEHERQLNAGRRTEPEYLKAGRKLYQLLLGEGPGNRRVIVIADDVLGRLNWETLVAGPKPHFWLEDVVVSRAFSITSLAAGEPESASDTLLIYGNPDLPAAKYPALLRAEEEIRRVQAVYRPGRTTVVDHQRAEAAAFAAQRPEQFGYIHFVTHGEASLRSPLESALIFSGQPESRLTALSVAQRQLNAKLVTLSACHSAGIKAYRGAGLVGMGWAFLHAGAQSVIAGLWEVNDGASARLHPSLYARIAKGETPAEALREAKLELVRSDTNFSKPYYWGAWVLFEGRP